MQSELATLNRRVQLDEVYMLQHRSTNHCEKQAAVPRLGEHLVHDALPVLLDDLRTYVVVRVLCGVEPSLYQWLPIHICIKQMKLPNYQRR